MFGTHSKFARENNFLALGVCCPGTTGTKRVPHMSNRNWNWVRKSNPSRLVDDCACKNQGYPTPPRVPGLPIRNCAGSSNLLVPRGTKVSAIDVTQKLFFERLYWFQDWAHLSPKSTVRVLPLPHCSLYNYFSISVQFFSDVAPHFLSAHDSPSNLA